MSARTVVATLSLALLASLSVVACSGPTPQEQDEEEARALGRDTDETVFDDMVQTQDKARAVEDVTLDHKDRLDQALESAEGDTPADDE